MTEEKAPAHYCYQCDLPTSYLFDDGRCGKCTGLTPEEVMGTATVTDEGEEHE